MYKQLAFYIVPLLFLSSFTVKAETDWSYGDWDKKEVMIDRTMRIKMQLESGQEKDTRQQERLDKNKLQEVQELLDKNMPKIPTDAVNNLTR